MKKFQTPDTFVIMFFLVLVAALLTYIVPAGQFDTEEVTFVYQGEEQTKKVLIPESFHIPKTEQGEDLKVSVPLFAPGGEMGFLNYLFEGLVAGSKWGSAVGVIAFILIVGGSFGIIMKTRAVEEGLLSIINRTKGRENLIIPLMFFLFSLGGAVFGMGEEAIAFAMILIPIVIALGYDAITGIMITYVATQIGFATSWMNPFGVAIAQGISEIPVLSGAPFRIGMWLFFTLVGTTYTWIYASRIRKNPMKSVSYDSDAYFRNDFKEKKVEVQFQFGHKLILLTVVLGISWIIWGVVKHAYYIPEIATQFFTIGIISGIIGVVFKLNNMTINDMASSFKQGAMNLLPAAMIVGMAKGIVLMLGGDNPQQPSVLNTILFSAADSIEGLSPVVAAWIMYVFQAVFNFFVVSGSGQAALTMPLLAPLADIAGVTRQVAVLAYQLGDGFTNLIVPTSGALMGVLGAARLDWLKWFTFQIKFQILLFVLGSIFVIGATIIGLQ